MSLPTVGPNIGSFVIDPKSDIFKDLAPVCDPAHPYRCLIGTWGQMHLGCRLRANANHDDLEKSYIGVSPGGDYGWKRPMLADEWAYALQFDRAFEMDEENGLLKPNMRKMPRKALTVRVDLRDGTWNPVLKRESTSHGGPEGTGKVERSGNTAKKFVRRKQLENLLKLSSA